MKFTGIAAMVDALKARGYGDLRVIDLRPGDAGRTVLTAVAPARGLLGLRSLLMTATRGTALVHQHHQAWQPAQEFHPHTHLR